MESSTSSLEKPAASERPEGAKRAERGSAASGNADRLDLRALPLNLDTLDELEAEDLVAFVREDERPLQGLAGLLDWRLCGFLTRSVRSGVFRGAKGEPLLTVSNGKIGPARLFLFGLGQVEGEEVEAQIGAALRAVAEAGGKNLALAPPAGDGRATAVVAREVARLAHEAGLRRLALLSEDPRAMDKALAVVESTFAWAYLED